MRPRTVLSSLSIAVIALAVLGLPRAASNPPACFRAAVDADLDPADGAEAAAIDGGDLILVGERGTTDRLRLPASGAHLRHAASRPGSGTVYVSDARGPDTLVVLDEDGSDSLRAAGEATHPAIGPGGAVAWAEDLERLRLRLSGGRVRTVAPPKMSRAVFSPVFLGPRRLAAVVEEPASGSTHDATLDNLFALNRATGRWNRLTAFRAGVDRWSAIRTPVVGRDGTVWFVRVTGRASATRRPAFELWRVGAGGPVRVRSLPGEAFLAGAVGGGLLWNVYDPPAWRLLLGGPGRVRFVGCGAAMVEPRSVADPDLVTPSLALEEEGWAVSAPEDGLLGIVVGDFDTRVDAEAAVERIGMSARAVGHGGAPAAVGPDRFAAAIPLQADVDVVEALDEFRQGYPEFAGSSWIAVLRAPGEEVG
jgi:hypothetical protein